MIRSLLDEGETQKAVEEARRWLVKSPSNPQVMLNVGGVFIDAGRISDSALIKEGAKLCEGARAALTDNEMLRATATYNLANGLLALHDMQGGAAYFRVAFEEELHRISSLYYEAIDSGQPISREARLNFATALQRQGRSVEALDLALACARENPDFARAWSTVGDVASGVFNFYSPDAALLVDAIQGYDRALDLERHDLVFRKSVQERRDHLSAHVKRPLKGHPELQECPDVVERLLPPGDPWSDSIEEFIWRSGLALNFCSGCRTKEGNGYDRFPLPGFLVGKDLKDSKQVPGEINALLQGYIGARALLWMSRSSAAKPVKVLRLPLDGAAFSRRAMFLMASLREAYGIFDRIATSLNHGLKMGLSEWDVSFAKLFFVRKGKKGHREFRTGQKYPAAVGLRALVYLAASFEMAEGRFGPLRTLRNNLQHSIVIPTEDPQIGGFGPWKTEPLDSLEAKVFEILRLSRAAMFYFVNPVRTGQQALRKRLESVGLRVSESRVDIERD